ncbi:MAG: phosphate ABC transporter permease subunit PstC [Anaerolineae bacterium]
MQRVLPTQAATTSKAQILERALAGKRASANTLHKRPRIGEEIIRAVLFASGIFSVLITIFIVVYLGVEALGFFNAHAWLPTKTAVINESVPAITLRPDEGAINASDTVLLLDVAEDQAIPYTPNTLIRIDNEIMRVTERRTASIVVERGYRGTAAAAHTAGSPVMAMQEVQVNLTGALNASDTQIALTPGYGLAFQVDQLIRVNSEEMRVLTVAPDSITVERGINGTTAAAHNAEATLEYADAPSLAEFFTSTQWQPQIGAFGILPLVNATLMTTFFALVVAIPVGLGVAIYLSEYASPRTRSILGPVIELLVGVPTVVFGYFALEFVTQGVLRPLFGSDVVNIQNTLSAGLVVGIMIVPTIASMSIDAMNAVPRALREASYGLGATKFETTVKVVLPAALSGIIAAVILGMSRAIGETMIVAIAAGSGPAFTFNPFAGAETMTGHIARISGGDLSYQSIDYESIFAIGLTLFLITLALTQISTYITRRFREVYE